MRELGESLPGRLILFQEERRNSMEKMALQVIAPLLKSWQGVEFQARSRELGRMGNLCKWELSPDCCLQEAHSLETRLNNMQHNSSPETGQEEWWN